MSDFPNKPKKILKIHSPKTSISKTQSDSSQLIFGEQVSHEAVLAMLRKNPIVHDKFLSFRPQYQNELLEFFSGNQGLRITYDPFFQKLFNPKLYPGRLEAFISAVFGQEIHIIDVLPREGDRLSGESSLVIMDMVVQLSDGSYLNVEIQKIGYAFPGERACCYSSDLILRQYDYLKAQKGVKFSYHDMQPVHVIVILEESSSAFLEAAPYYLHKRQVSYDSGAQVTELAEIVYISLDTFKKVVHNEINNPLHAWLTFFIAQDAPTILKLVEKYPDFLPLYQEIATFRKNPEELINMYSEALAIMDHNTEVYMLEETRKELAAIKAETEAARAEFEAAKAEFEAAKAESEAAKAESEAAKAESATAKAESEAAKAESAAAKAESEAAKADAAEKDAKVTQLASQNDKLALEVEHLQQLLAENGIQYSL
jgi:hypothetical protein